VTPNDEIADFYNRHPYPPPVADLDGYAASHDLRDRRVEHHRKWPWMPYRYDRKILVAGCGTSQAAKYALRTPEAAVVGIDVSPTSVAKTQELAERYDIQNLEVVQLAIEDAASLDAQFDEIVCTGVLHHLVDPVLGLTALRGVLAPSGALNLMVYAKYGRTGISMIQDYCRRLDVTASATDLADLVATLRELPEGHPLGHLLRNTPDFRDDDALADALLNPRETAYSVPEFFELVATSGLRLGRWVRQAPYLPDCGSMSLTPHRDRIAALSIEDQYAAVELFRGTMTRHSAILHHGGETVGSGAVRFDDESWRSYVPIRPTTVVSVEERLPPGAEAALLNRAHSYPDLVMFVDAEQKGQFEAIDGRRTAGAIANEPDFFERLWRHDLVVFDTSQGGVS